jgi:hypothetical protein
MPKCITNANNNSNKSTVAIMKPISKERPAPKFIEKLRTHTVGKNLQHIQGKTKENEV